MELLKTQINILVYALYGFTNSEKEIIRKGGNKEISARLSFLGNIRQPMALSVLGRLLICHHYLPLKTTGGKRGYFVVEKTNNQQDMKDIINELEDS